MSQSTVAITRYGKLEGTFEDGLYIFRGIPYASPPVGDRRWMPPTPPLPWADIKPAKKFTPIAPQPVNQMGTMIGLAAPETQSEDCLYLNVWSPGLDDKKRPVMVWLHGGAFSMGSGSSSLHPGNILAKRGDVVVVSLNYRLGSLGFFHLKTVTDGRIPSTGTEGLLDQIAALKWVQDDIAAFGGDPQNVTVFGESAGGMSIGCLLAMPLARGLFHKAILQSGSNTVKSISQAVELSEIFLEILGLKARDAEALKALPVERLIKAQQELSVQMLKKHVRGAVLKPVIDGETIFKYPVDAVREGSAGNVPIIVGSNLEEARILTRGDEDLETLTEEGMTRRLTQMIPAESAPAIIKDFREVRRSRGQDISPGAMIVAMQTYLQFRVPAVRMVEAQCSRDVSAYNYLFTWKSAVPALGACHALDVGFVFGYLNTAFHGCGPEAEKLAAFMQDSWIAFARTGNPSTPACEWPPYCKGRKTMVLGSESHIEEAPYEQELRLWDGISNRYLGW